MSDKKIRILALCDTPTSATGFAQLSRNVLQGLAKTGKYEIDVIGINYFGDFYDRNVHPYNIYPAMPQGMQDMYGRGRLIQSLAGNEAANGLRPPWDIVFTIQDPFVIEGLGAGFPFAEQLKVTLELWKRSLPPEQWFSWIGYFPIDSDLKENWVTKSMMLADIPVMYCDWGKSKILKFDKTNHYLKFTLRNTENDNVKQPAQMQISPLADRVKVIPHGVDLVDFHPIDARIRNSFREKYFGGFVKKDTYLVVNVSRNQPRKDLARTMQVFSLFKKRVPKAMLYLHCKEEDAGGSIHEMARNFNLIPGEDYMIPNDFKANTGFPIETVNNIYNAADLCITTTLGEGWGFMLTEAMATKTPIIAPNITSVLDIFDSYDYDGSLAQLIASKKLRGIPVRAGSTSSEYICLGLTDNERIRPLTNVDDMVEKMVWAYRNKEKVAGITQRAFDWVQKLGWKDIVIQWDTLFTEAFQKLERDRELARKVATVGRNDLCPCGSTKKFKKCHGELVNSDKYKDWLQV